MLIDVSAGGITLRIAPLTINGQAVHSPDAYWLTVETSGIEIGGNDAAGVVVGVAR